MKIKSKPHIWPILSVLLMIISSGLFTYFFFHLILFDKPIPLGVFIILGLFTTLGVWTFILAIYFFKIISISQENISISFPLRLKKYEFEISELKSYCIYKNSGYYKNYESLHFQTSDMSTFMIMQYEFWNYKKIRDVIITFSKKGEISKYHNFRQILILFTISLIITFGTAGLIELMNQIIK
jgi:hypothetical protein